MLPTSHFNENNMFHFQEVALLMTMCYHCLIKGHRPFTGSSGQSCTDTETYHKGIIRLVKGYKFHYITHNS